MTLNRSSITTHQGGRVEGHHERTRMKLRRQIPIVIAADLATAVGSYWLAGWRGCLIYVVASTVGFVDAMFRCEP